MISRAIPMAVVLVASVAFGSSVETHDASNRIVVLPFTGPMAAEARGAVVKSLEPQREWSVTNVRSVDDTVNVLKLRNQGQLDMADLGEALGARFIIAGRADAQGGVVQVLSAHSGLLLAEQPFVRRGHSVTAAMFSLGPVLADLRAGKTPHPITAVVAAAPPRLPASATLARLTPAQQKRKHRLPVPSAGGEKKGRTTRVAMATRL